MTLTLTCPLAWHGFNTMQKTLQKYISQELKKVVLKGEPFTPDLRPKLIFRNHALDRLRERFPDKTLGDIEFDIFRNIKPKTAYYRGQSRILVVGEITRYILGSNGRVITIFPEKPSSFEDTGTHISRAKARSIRSQIRG